MIWLATQCVSAGGDGAALESRLGGEAFVTLVKPADLRNRDHLAAVWRLDGASIRAVFVEREMGPRAVIVIDVRDQDAAQMALVNHEYVIQALAANRADDPLDVAPSLIFRGCIEVREGFSQFPFFFWGINTSLWCRRRGGG